MTGVTDTGIVTTATDLLFTGGGEGYSQALAMAGLSLFCVRLIEGGLKCLHGPEPMRRQECGNREGWVYARFFEPVLDTGTRRSS